MSSPASNLACGKISLEANYHSLQTSSFYLQLLLNDSYHHRLQDLCGDGWEHPLVIVLANTGEDAWQLVGDRPEEDAQCDVYILQICGGNF